MAPARPHLSITLPRNFTFHYKDGQGPKTPEREKTETPSPCPPPIYRIKRRPRQSITLLGTQNLENTQDHAHEIVLPTIETTEPVEPARPSFLQRASAPVEGYLNPAAMDCQLPLPTTPTAQVASLRGQAPDLPGWRDRSELTPSEYTSRPMSSCSDLSTSSESSNGTWRSFPSLGGSCTTPDSEAPEPFGMSFPLKRKGKVRPAINTDDPALPGTEQQKHASGKYKKAVWTENMDNHLWATYLSYLQDPTVTPFKMLPGTAPPIGVCYRVAREAKKTWRPTKQSLDTIFEGGLQGPYAGKQTSRNVDGIAEADTRTKSPDTIKACRSGSNTPTVPATKVYQWPESSSATRRRLIELCKSKPTIAPHYQRLMRSPSPVVSHTSSSRSLSSRLSTPAPRRPSSMARFTTRDIGLSLITSTSDTMQPDGALAQLARVSSNTTEESHDNEWFNNPVQPTSTSAASSGQEGLGIDGVEAGSGLPRLGSPFGFHTWGPSYTRDSRSYIRSTSPRALSDDSSVLGPTLRSPVQMHHPFPLPPVLKRRAQHLLEEELSPGGTDIGSTAIEDMFGAPAEGSHRRVRSRGFSLGDITGDGRTTSIFTPPTTFDQVNSSEFGETATFGSALTPPAAPPIVRRLGSPFSFEGPSSDMATSPTEHRHTSSNTFPRSSHDLNFASSIDERLNDWTDTEDEASRKRAKE